MLRSRSLKLFKLVLFFQCFGGKTKKATTEDVVDDDSRLHNNISSVGNVYTYAGNTATVIVSTEIVFR